MLDFKIKIEKKYTVWILSHITLSVAKVMEIIHLNESRTVIHLQLIIKIKDY